MVYLAGLLLWYAVVIGVAVVAVPLAAIGLAARCGALYVSTLWHVAAASLRLTGPLKYPPVDPPPEGSEPAYTQYFWGQAMQDLSDTASRAWKESQAVFRALADRINNAVAGAGDPAFAVPAGFAAWIGLVLGGALAAAATLVLIAVHALAAVLVQTVARVVIGVLRLVDTALLRIKGIGISCPSCGDRVVYPSYECPKCRRRHRDVRPGRYGVMRRTCMCREQLPTLILLGSHKLPAFCPSCSKPLVEGAGTAPEMRVPFFGATAAGKTRLMLAITKALHEMAGEHGASVVAADRETAREHDNLVRVLLDGKDTERTPIDLLRAHSFHVTPARGGTRLFRLIDAAGERFKSSDRLQELAYLKIARSFVFVVDPLSVDAFWESLTTQERERLDGARRRFEQPEFVFQQTLENIHEMGGSTSAGRLAVALSKADLLAGLSIVDGKPLDHDAIAALLDERLGLGNMVRSMRQNFAEVTFFSTAAVVNGHGTVDASARTITDWLLRGEGLQLDVRS